MMKKIILHTFDYELFLGQDSGSVDKCLIEPTNHILRILQKHKISNALFFIDTMYLWRLKEEKSQSCRKDYDKIFTQLREILQQGHYLYIHPHPHWLDAKYHSTSNRWELTDYSRYRFNQLDESEKQFVFETSIKILNEIKQDVTQHYNANAFRAGGWCIQPFSDFKPFFEKYGILYDFSVLKNFVWTSNIQLFDYREVKKDYYKFNEDILLPDDNGKFIEFTISTYEENNTNMLLEKITNKVLWNLNIKSLGDGLSIASKTEFASNSALKYCSIENMNIATLPLYVKMLKKQHYIQFITHPKMLSLHNIKTFDKLCQYIKSNFKSVITNFNEIEVE